MKFRNLIIVFILLSNFSDAYSSQKKYISSIAGLNLRENKDVASKVISTIPFGKEISILQEDEEEIFLSDRYGKWLKVEYFGKTGWLFSGFLCDFDPTPLIKLVSDFYREQYRADKFFSKHSDYTHFSNKDVKIERILENYIVLRIPITPQDTFDISSGNVIWKYDVNEKRFFEIYNIGHANKMFLFYLDDDKRPDLIIQDGCCCDAFYHYIIDLEKGEKKSLGIRCDDEKSKVSIGHCDSTEILCRNFKEKLNYHYKYNCTKELFELYKKD